MAASQIHEQASQFANSIHVATCWWKKSCTRWYLPIIYRVFYIQTVVGLGISETSTVLCVWCIFIREKMPSDQAINCDIRGRGQGSFKTPSIRSTRIALDLSVSWWATMTTLPKINSSPLKSYLPNRKVVFQPSFFRGYVKLPGGRWWFVSNIFYVHPRTLGKMNPIWLLHIFQMGWVKTNYN